MLFSKSLVLLVLNMKKSMTFLCLKTLN